LVKKGDTIYDVQKYVKFRIQHLRLEREKIPYYVEKSKIQKSIDKLSSKISELEKIKKVLNEDIKTHAKYEWDKWQHLKKMKDFENEKKERDKNKSDS
jgi:hypothetical protein